MSDLHRRGVLTLGAALGLATAVNVGPAFSIGPSGYVPPVGPGTDPAWVWDDTIDQIMAGVVTNGQVAAVNDSIRSWVDNNDPVPANLPGGLTPWLQQNTKLPAWADVSLLNHAADFNRRHDTLLFLLYGLGAGIMSTVIPREARSVYWSKGGADMQDRAAKTFAFGYDLSQRDGLQPTGQFLVTANKTRLVHATVRHLLPQSPHWKAVAEESIPISNLDILTTFHSLGTFVHKKLTEWKVPMSQRDQEAYLHLWQVAVSQLGVQDRFIPRSWTEAYAQSNTALTAILRPTFEGDELAEVLLGLTAQIDGGLTRGFLNEFVIYLLGDNVANWYGLKRDPVSAALIKTGWPVYLKFRQGTLPFLPITYYVFDQLVRGVAMLFLNKGQSHTTTPIEIPDINRPS